MIKSIVSQVVLFGLLALMISGCQSSDDSAEQVKLERFDLAMAAYSGSDESVRSQVRTQYDQALKMIMAMRGDVMSDDAFVQYSDSKAVKVFTHDVDSVYGDVSDIEEVMSKILSNAKDLLPAIPHRRYFAIVSPYNTSIFADDSTMLIALNHYLGADYPGYAGFDNYLRQNKTREKLPYDIAEALVALAYPYQPDENETLLNRMLYEGALLEAIMRLVPEAQESLAMGYTTEQLEWLRVNSKQAWQAVVGRQLLYSTSSSDIDRMVNPAPKTMLLHQESPGRAGRFIGYCITQSYLSHHKDATLEHLLSPDYYNSRSTLVESEYSGESDFK